jgi:hypothetical protein
VYSTRVCWDGAGRSFAAPDFAHQRIVVRTGEGFGRELGPFALDRGSYVALSPDGRWLAAGPWRAEEAKVWNVNTGKIALRLSAEQSNVWCLEAAFSPDGRWLVTGGPTEFRFWRVGSWEPGPVVLRERRNEEGGAPLAFSGGGRLLAVAHSRERVKLLRGDTGAEVATLASPEPLHVTSLAFSPDGSWVVAGTAQYMVLVWDLRLIRRQLAAFGLDWKMADPPPPAAGRTGVASVEVLPGDLDPRGKEHPFGAKEPLEAEDLPVITWADCNWSVEDMAPRSWSNGKHLLCRARRGGYVELEVDLPRPGRYALDVYFTCAENFGEVAVSLDGERVGPVYDSYRFPIFPSGPVAMGCRELRQGKHRLRFTAVGKNPRSHDYHFGIDCLEFRLVP